MLTESHQRGLGNKERNNEELRIKSPGALAFKLLPKYDDDDDGDDNDDDDYDW